MCGLPNKPLVRTAHDCETGLFVFVCVTTQSWLWMAVCKWCKIQEINIFTFNKIYLYSKHYFISSNYIFMQLQGILFFQLQGKDILVNCQGKKLIQRTCFFFTKSITIRGNYIRSRNYIHFNELIVHSRKLYSFKELSSFKENINSGKLYSFKEI